MHEKPIGPQTKESTREFGLQNRNVMIPTIT